MKKTKIKIILKNNSVVEAELEGNYKVRTIMYWAKKNYPEAKEVIYKGRLVEVPESIKIPNHSKIHNEECKD